MYFVGIDYVLILRHLNQNVACSLHRALGLFNDQYLNH